MSRGAPSGYTLAVHPAQQSTGFHDPAAAIFEDGRLRYGAEEERFTRVKHAEGTFPTRAVEACLAHCDVEMGDLDRVVVPWDVALAWRKVDRDYLTDAVTRPTSLPHRLARIVRYGYWNRFPDRVPDGVRTKLAEIGEPVPDVETRPHHACHAASAFHPSGFERATVLTIDGEGEHDSTVVWRAGPDGLRRVRTYKGYNSLGGFYGAVTEYLGFRAYNGEGKVMGLAPYGERNADIESRLRGAIDTGADYDVSPIAAAGTSKGVERLEAILGREARRGRNTDEFTDWEKDLAATVQYLLEEIVSDVARAYVPEDGGNLCLAGGVALNCKLNKVLMELDRVDELFIQPVAHDAGTALGAGWIDADPADVPEMREVYLGSGYDTEEITDRLETNGVAYHQPDDVVEYAADALADGKLVGWFQGRFEMGPRALGGRSILADPRTVDSRDRVNRRVKHRETWRPFAPSMLESAGDDYLENAGPSPFMIKTFDVLPERADDIPAVLHPGDDTTRPQTVTEDQHPRYHALISAFEERTGVPVVLNTSFNDKGEPIVNTPQEAVKDFFGMGLDVLVVEDVVVEKAAASAVPDEAAAETDEASAEADDQPTASAAED